MTGYLLRNALDRARPVHLARLASISSGFNFNVAFV
jgi:hypothetical protein